MRGVMGSFEEEDERVDGCETAGSVCEDQSDEKLERDDAQRACLTGAGGGHHGVLGEISGNTPKKQKVYDQDAGKGERPDVTCEEEGIET